MFDLPHRRLWAVTRRLLAVAAAAFVELILLVALALWGLDDLSNIALSIGDATTLTAMTIVAVGTGVRLAALVLGVARDWGTEITYWHRRRGDARGP
jgi:hypothetical protein